jgi:hypothetical protein
MLVGVGGEQCYEIRMYRVRHSSGTHSERGMDCVKGNI